MAQTPCRGESARSAPEASFIDIGALSSSSENPLPSPAPANVLDKSLADVSFLVGLLVEKFLYHLPLYRQHQRLGDAGITLSRSTLTNLTKRSIDLLRPSWMPSLHIPAHAEHPFWFNLNKHSGRS